MRRVGFLLVFLAALLFAAQAVGAQSSRPLVVVLTANNEVDPAMQDYIERGIQAAESGGAQAVIIQLDTPGGDIQSLTNIIEAIRASTVPVVIYVTPNGAMAAHASVSSGNDVSSRSVVTNGYSRLTCGIQRPT